MFKKSLPHDRKYQTLSSIPKESKEYNFFKNYIEIEEILFSNDLKVENMEDLFNKIISILEENKEDSHLFQYLIEIIVYFILIRSKQAEISCILMSLFVTKFDKAKQNFIINTIKDSEYYNKSIFIQDFLYAQGIVNEEPKAFKERQETLFSLYEKGSLEFILKEDSSESLKDYINSHSNFSKRTDINVDIRSSLFQILRKRSSGSTRVNLLDFCSFYGSIECFKILKMNDFEFGDVIREMSICGGNFDIIRELEQCGLAFDNLLECSVQFHQKEIIEWLLSNYNCEVFLLRNALIYLDYETFLFMLLNGENVNSGKFPPLVYLFRQREPNIELIRFLIERGEKIDAKTLTLLQKTGNPQLLSLLTK